MKEKIGIIIKAARKRSDMTQEQLAKEMDKTQKTISLWERGTTTPSIVDWKKLQSLIDIKGVEQEVFKE